MLREAEALAAGWPGAEVHVVALTRHYAEPGELRDVRGRLAASGHGLVEVTGLSGGFTDLIGTISATGSPAAGTYVFELQPAAPSPEPGEPTETVDIEYDTTSVVAWTTFDPETGLCTADSAFGGGSTITGDIVGSSGWTGNVSSEQVFSINVGTLNGEGDGVFITVSPVVPAETYTGPFAGLAGVGTSTGTTRDATGAFAPAAAATFEVSR